MVAEVRGGVVVEVWVVVMEVVMAVAAHHLRHDPQREPQLRLREVAHVDAVEGDAAALQVEGMEEVSMGGGGGGGRGSAVVAVAARHTCTSYSRKSSLPSVDLPPPLGPTTATVCPGAISKSTSRSTAWSCE